MSMIAAEVFIAAVDAADPAVCVRANWPGSLEGAEQVSVIAIGKAAAAMANEAARLLCQSSPSKLTAGVVVCPPEHVGAVHGHGGRVRAFAADHPEPTARNLAASAAVSALADRIGETDLALVLISGGASAHLCSPAPGISLCELTAVTSGLMRAGAPIEELNTVRRCIELLKGGGLARLIYPARSEVLVLSDVIGDPLSVIASGPMTPSPTSPADALRVLEMRGLQELSPAVTAFLHRAVQAVTHSIPETAAIDERVSDRVNTSVIGNNFNAIEGVRTRLVSMGIDVVEHRGGIVADAATAGRELVRQLKELSTGPQAIVWGGETTVDTGGEVGSGGPCQELALAAAIELDGSDQLGVIAISTDGIDGPTDAAGAWSDGGSCEIMRDAGVDPQSALGEHDSNLAMRVAGGRVLGRLTGTNVNDVYVGLKQ